MNSIAVLIISLGIILIGAEVFVNGIEWLGKKLNLSEGAVGSVLAAVGTALPETLIPIIAILFSPGAHGHEIGIGAILGAPLMLSTLAMFVTGMAVLIFARRRQHGCKVMADYHTMKRDLFFFILVYLTAVLAGLIPPAYRFVQLLIAAILITAYIFYVRVLFKEQRDIGADEGLPDCYFARRQSNPPLLRICAQILTALFFIVLGAKLFVNSVSVAAVYYGVPAFILAIIITPIATELPEKFNSVIWISRDKDTLALGNITGAMVFQSSMIPALGILLTDWQLTAGALYSAAIALASSLLIYLELKRKKHITVGTLLLGGIMYAFFFLSVVKGFIQ